MTDEGWPLSRIATVALLAAERRCNREMRDVVDARAWGDYLYMREDIDAHRASTINRPVHGRVGRYEAMTLCP